MHVELVPHIAIGVRSKQPVHFEQYQVLVNGLMSGYLSFKPGSRICLIKKFGPLDQRAIEERVAELLQSETVGSTQVPDVPPEYRQQLKDNEEGIDASDID